MSDDVCPHCNHRWSGHAQKWMGEHRRCYCGCMWAVPEPPPKPEPVDPRPVVYLVMDNQIESNEVIRVYTDKAEADAFVEAFNHTRGGWYEVEEHHLGAPNVPFDGPVWHASWTTRRKLKSERQLALRLDNGFTMVVPSAVPSGAGYRYQEFFTGNWGLNQPELEEPPVWIDSFHEPWQEWHEGDPVPEAEVKSIEEHRVIVRGTSKTAVEQLLRSTAQAVKVELEAKQ